ncbi:MAG: hypothetical protein JWN18_462 [Parcubacteria group bacterium]|nr:hypothetical protein [Parcubacteria group bacterium]
MFWAAAAKWLDMLVDVFFPIVIREFVAHFNILYSVDKHFPFHNLRLTVGDARMVDIACGVLARGAVDRLPTIHFKKVFALTRVLFFFRNLATKVFDNPLTFLKRARSKKAESSA